MMNYTLKDIMFLFQNILVFFILLVMTLITIEDQFLWNHWSVIIAYSSILLLAFQLIQLFLRGTSYLDFKVWFIVLLHLFMFGRVYLNAFGLDENIFWDLINRYPNDLMFKTSMYILLSIHAMFIGLTINSTSTATTDIQVSKIKNNGTRMFNNSRTLKVVGVILLVFSLPFRIFIDINSILATQSASAYSAIQQHVGLADDFALLFVPSLIIIISTYQKGQKNQLIILSLSILYFMAVIILTGDRRYPVTGIIAISLCFMAKNKINFSLMKSAIILIGGVVFLNILATVRKIRSEQLTSFFDFFNQYGKELFSLDIFYETLAEFGLSFFSVVAIVKHIPSSVDFLYGMTFLGSIPSLLPVGFIFGDFFDSISLSSSTINKIDGYPVGATLLGDLYANFGWTAIFFSVLFGILLSKIFNSQSININAYYLSRYYILFYILINLVRSSFLEIFRASFMVYLFPIIIYALLTQIKKQRKRTENGER